MESSPGHYTSHSAGGKGWTLQQPPCRKDFLLRAVSDQPGGVIS